MGANSEENGEKTGGGGGKMLKKKKLGGVSSAELSWLVHCYRLGYIYSILVYLARP